MTGRYKAYPEYKSTDEVWLGNVPSHWRDLKINRLTIVKRGASPRPIDDPKYFDEAGEYSWVRIADVTASDTYLENTPQRLSPLGASLSVKLEPNELFLSIAGTVGKPCINKIKVCIHDGFVYFPEYKENTKFLFYIFAAGEAYKGLGKFGTQLNLNTETVGGIKIGIPCIEEQHKIVNFLDHETAKIDTLIAKQEKLIELLKEKRQAVISHAVTKGLNPNAPMKDSGVEWLGEVPEHWSLCSIKYLCREITDGAHISPDLKEGVHHFVSIKDIKNGEINFDDSLLTSEESYHYLVKTGCMPFEGDILFSKDGTIGQTAITPPNKDFVVASSLIIIRPNLEKVSSEYLDLMLQSSLVKEQVESFVKGAALRRLSIQNLLKVFGLRPPLNEQKKIAEHVNLQLSKFSALEDKAQKQVQLLQERKTALISAAVTGKIDVRHFVTEQGQPQGAQG
ncbi:restriction endonuclease subunit S [Vibrio cholerae]|uniref:restriction endonuclease subunit S n=1 Tax=Vibrio cholerae TaxID=666 RepID=UPI001E177BA9|nr:restriction endonuclease subunit S [Vibrio cholerae]EGQ8673071.1 restriction endonuclease subunit S [Vibrio cholerae]EJL7968203.1 restriction endonuclease subunit S [Vibrio cholerae]ELN6894337.1 restriction endonuclease subunit S [Vibrio cholerae]MCI4612945.1 restriction endonuclease subunit S [Vibrio cholerae]